MKLPTGGTSTPPRIVVFRALALGDMLCAVPALRALRGGAPQARITLIGLPWARSFVERFGAYVDAFVEFPGFPGIPERPLDPAATTRFLARFQADAVDLAIQLQGNGTVSNAFVELLGARQVAGFLPAGMSSPRRGSFLEYPAHLHETRRHLALMMFLGAPDLGADLEFPIRDPERAEADQVLAAHSLEAGSFVCVHPGAAEPGRRWPAERFAVVADALARLGLRVVLTGTAAERPLTHAVAGAMEEEPIDLAGHTSLGVLGSVLERARLLVSNDTGVSHIAAALRVPSVIVFLASDPERWAPLDRRLHRPVGEVSGNQCRHADQAHRCLGDACSMLERRLGPLALLRPMATPDAVLAEARDLLAMPPAAGVGVDGSIRSRGTRVADGRGVTGREVADVA